MRVRSITFGALSVVIGACAFLLVGHVTGDKGTQNQSPNLLPATSSRTNSIETAINERANVPRDQTGDNTKTNSGRPDRIIDAEMKIELTRHIPKNKKVGILVLSGDPERDNFADQIDAFLKSQGYTVLSPHGSFQIASGGRPLAGTALMPDGKDPDLMIIRIGTNTR